MEGKEREFAVRATARGVDGLVGQSGIGKAEL